MEIREPIRRRLERMPVRRCRSSGRTKPTSPRLLPHDVAAPSNLEQLYRTTSLTPYVYWVGPSGFRQTRKCDRDGPTTQRC